MPELTLVTGATGAQGGSVAKRLLARGRAVRALTRRASSPAARELAALGAELVEGDLGDASALCAAMRGCAAVFGVTNYWEHAGLETVHGRNLVDAARATDVPRLVLSTLPSSEQLSGGALSVPHFESKAAVEAYARSSGVPVTFLHVAFYFENFLHFFPPRLGAQGRLQFGFPQGDTKLAGVAAEDVGVIVDAILQRTAPYRGEAFGVVAEELRGAEYAAVLSAVLGREVCYTSIPRAEYARLPFPGAQDLADMFELNRVFIPSRAGDVAATRALHPEVQSFRRWAEAHRAELLAVCESAA